MDNNPTPTPAPEPQPAPAPEPPTSPAPEPTPEPAPAPAPEPAPELAPEPTPEPTPEPAPTPQPAPAPAPEPAPAPAPEPAPAPTPEPAPAPEPIAMPEEPAPINPFNPTAASAEPIPAPAPAPKQGKGKLIGIIAGVATLVIAVAVVLVLHFTSSTPEKILNNAIINRLSATTIAFSATTEWEQSTSTGFDIIATGVDGEDTEPAETKTMSYSIDAYIPDSTTSYIRINGFSSIFGSLLSLFGGSLSSEFNDAFSQIDGTWWKVDANAKSESSSVISLTNYTIDTEAAKKVLDIYKQNPFLVATKSTENKTYKTSGTAYTITIDKTKYDAFKNALANTEVSASGLTLGPLTLSDDSFEDTKIVMTIQSSFFGGGTLTGVYSEPAGDSTSNQKSSVDFEHVLTAAPADAKDVSELITALQKINGGSSSDTSDAEQRDIERRNDYAALSTNITSYITNNNGNLPPVGTLDASTYVNATGIDPSGYPYALEVIDYAGNYEMGWGVNPGDSTNVYVALHATCQNGELASADGARAFAIAGSLEDGSYYCLASN